MDYNKIIRELYADKQRLDRVIRELEQLHDAQQTAGTSPPSRDPRGRKSMGAQERKEVSRRMKSYWAKRPSGTDEPA
jgi:hypothetical protein